MYDKIAYIHNNKLAKWNYEYIGKDGTIYVGQRDGRLKKKEVAVATTPTTGLDVSLAWGNITGTITNQADLVNYINTIIGALTLDGLADVVITAPVNGQVLSYNAATNTWVNATVAGVGTVTSVGLTMPPAFTVAGTPVTAAGVLAVTAAGNATQYIRGDGQLATFPTIPPATTVTGRTGDINVVTSGSNYEVQNAVLPFLLMGC